MLAVAYGMAVQAAGVTLCLPSKMFPLDKPTAKTLQRWCDRFLDATQWKQLQAVIRTARRDKSQSRTVHLSNRAYALLHHLAEREQLTLSETIERHLADVAAAQTRQDPPPSTEQISTKPTATSTDTPERTPLTVAPQKHHRAFVTTKKGVCYLTIKISRHNFSLMRMYHYTIDAQDKRAMRRLHPDVIFDWKNIARQLAEKREVCRRYRSRRRTPRMPREREPFYGVVEPSTRTVYVSDPGNIAGVGALLDTLLSRGR